MLTFVIGLLVGMILGVVVMCLCQIQKNNYEE